MTKPWNGYRCAECGNPTIIQVGSLWYCVDHVHPALAVVRASVEAAWANQFTDHAE